MTFPKLRLPFAAAYAAAMLFFASSCDLGSPIKTSSPTEVEGLTGTLVGPDGKPISGAWVKVYPVPAAATAKAAAWTPSGLVAGPALDSIRTGTTGAFNLSKLADGTYNLAASAQRNDTTLALFLRDVIVTGKTNLGVDTLKVAGSLLVQVVSGGNVVPGAQCAVPASPYVAASDSSGNCLLNGVPPGSFQVTITHPLYQIRITGNLSVLSGLLNEFGLIQLINLFNPPPSGQNFPLTASTAALWTFNAYDGSGRIPDQGPKNLHLTPSGTLPLDSAPQGKAAVFNGDGRRFSVAHDSALTIAGTGRLTLEARVFLTSYPPTSNQSQSAHVVGMYEGLKLIIMSDGSLQAGGQVGNGSTWSWYAAKGAPGTVPLNRWVNLAVAVDQSQRQFYGYIDGVAVQLYKPYTTPFEQIRTGLSALTVGNSDRDDHPFTGKIDEIRVSQDLVLGAGLPLRDSSTPPTLLSPADSSMSLVATPTLAFSWSAVNGAAAYQIQVSPSAAFVSFTLNDTAVVGTSRTASLTLTSGVLHYWRVRARVGGSWGPWSTVRRFSTVAPPAPNPTPAPLGDTAIRADRDANIVGAPPSSSSQGVHANRNYGKSPYFAIGTYDMSTAARGAVHFTLPEGLPASRITKAVIRIHSNRWIARNVAPDSVRITAHALLRDWKEGTGTGRDGLANSSSIDGVTATERFWGSQNGSEDWTRRLVGLDGVDASSEPLAAATRPSGHLGNWDFDVTELAKAWADDSSKNFGVILTGSIPASAGLIESYPEFYSKDTNVADGYKPTLLLTLEKPQDSTFTASDTLYATRDGTVDTEAKNLGLSSELRLKYKEAVVLMDFPDLAAAATGKQFIKAELVLNAFTNDIPNQDLHLVRVPDADANRWTEGTGHWYYFDGQKRNGYDAAYSLYPGYVPPTGTTNPASPGIDASSMSLAQEIWNSDTTRIAARWQGTVPMSPGVYPLLASTKEIRIDITALIRQTGYRRILAIRQNPQAALGLVHFYSRDHAGREYGPKIVFTKSVSDTTTVH